jgi:hypothetical protein
MHGHNLSCFCKINKTNKKYYKIEFNFKKQQQQTNKK